MSSRPLGQWKAVRLVRDVPLALLLGLGVAAGLYWHMSTRLKAQEARVELVRKEVRRLEQQADEVERLRSLVGEVLGRKAVVEVVRRDGSALVRVLDLLARQRPAGAYLSGVRLEGVRLSVSGFAASHAEVAALVASLDGSPVLAGARLDELSLVASPQPVKFAVSAAIRQPVTAAIKQAAKK